MKHGEIKNSDGHERPKKSNPLPALQKFPYLQNGWINHKSLARFGSELHGTLIYGIIQFVSQYGLVPVRKTINYNHLKTLTTSWN